MVRAPRQLGRYRVLSALGRGASATVVRAHDEVLDRDVALKLVREPDDAVRAEELRGRLLHEARAQARAAHASIVPVYDAGSTAGWVYIAMRWMRGGDLQRLVRSGGREPAWCVRRLEEAARGIAAAHACGLAHRDVKPANLMLDEDGRCAVADFGIAAALGDGRASTAGTPNFLPPDAARLPAPAVDAWGLSATLFFALAGRPPFALQTPQDLSRIHRELTLEPLPASVQQQSPRLCAWLCRCLGSDADRRPADADAWRQGLERACAADGRDSAAAETISTARPSPAPIRDPVTEIEQPVASLADAVSASRPAGPTRRSKSRRSHPRRRQADHGMPLVTKAAIGLAVGVVGLGAAAGVWLGSRSDDDVASPPEPREPVASSLVASTVSEPNPTPQVSTGGRSGWDVQATHALPDARALLFAEHGSEPAEAAASGWPVHGDEDEPSQLVVTFDGPHRLMAVGGTWADAGPAWVRVEVQDLAGAWSALRRASRRHAVGPWRIDAAGRLCRGVRLTCYGTGAGSTTTPRLSGFRVHAYPAGD